MIKHAWSVFNGRIAYLCNFACGTTEEKIAETHEEVTCKNCIKILIKQGLL